MRQSVYRMLAVCLLTPLWLLAGAQATAGTAPTADRHYLEAGAAARTPGPDARNFSGHLLRASFGFDNGLFLAGEIFGAEDSADRDFDERSVGLGLSRAFSDRAQLVNRFDFHERDIDGDKERGVVFNVGAHARWHPRVETGAYVAWQRLGGNHERLVRGEVLGRLAGPLWLRAGIHHGEDVRGWEVGVRFTY